MLYDLHTHSFFSDGVLSPLELIRRANHNGYTALAITDHVGLGHLERLLSELVRDCSLARQHWGVTALPGVELTHLPPEAIPAAAQQAKELGAAVVVVHGETIIEPVPPGTNLAAVKSPHVDILAHPGLLSLKEAEIAAENGVLLEISARKGHSLTNGHIVKIACQAGAKLILNSDAHEPSDLLTRDLAQAIARGAGLDESKMDEVLLATPKIFLQRVPPPLRPKVAP